MTIDIKNSKPALLVLDYQRIIIEQFICAEAASQVVGNTHSLLNAAREASIPVIFVKVGFSKGYPEVNRNNALFSTIKGAGLLSLDDPHTAIHAELSPTRDEAVITKHRMGAFTGTALNMQLRAKGIDTLIMAGLTTAGVVLSTTRQALDLDYRVVVAEDCCADATAEKHTLITNQVLAEHAEITDSKSLQSLFRG
ncbi:hypothetical protein AB688_18745 [Pseudomonas putida]|uniref:isochorismatase family cysteine hydrolase n=1 Tax=Pseudomonas putida TaxID=303 RepID=UPI0007B6BFDA|nr:isochorismatase family cysteine hydrolase [Pseudomonas putida]ANC04036.1 hypothetical protein AB688_18745 [Pseudomonas putida]